MNSGENCKQSNAKTLFRFIISPVWKTYFFVPTLIFLKMLPTSSSHINPFDSAKFNNENSTFLHPLMNITQNASISDSNNDQRNIENLPWWCNCLSEIEDNENESECHCEGPKLLKVPQNLRQITRLSIANAKVKVLRETALRRYSLCLKDLWAEESQNHVHRVLIKIDFAFRFLTSLSDFYQIEPGAFKDIINLRTM